MGPLLAPVVVYWWDGVEKAWSWKVPSEGEAVILLFGNVEAGGRSYFPKAQDLPYTVGTRWLYMVGTCVRAVLVGSREGARPRRAWEFLLDRSQEGS